MAFVGLRVPAEAARLIATLDYGGLGKPEPTNAYHVTLLNLGDEVSMDRIAAAVEPLVEVVSQTKPYTATVREVTTFPPHPVKGTVPIICPVESADLHDMHKRLKDAFEKAGVSFSKRFPTFNPHVTLSYLPKEDPAFKPKPFDPVEWGVHEVVLWGGDRSDDRVVITVPLSLGTRGQIAANVKKTTFEAFVRLAMLRGENAPQPPILDPRPNRYAATKDPSLDPLRPKRLSIVEKVLLRYATQQVEAGHEPLNTQLWKQAQEEAKKRFKKSGAYADGWAAQWYNREGGEWKKL